MLASVGRWLAANPLARDGLSILFSTLLSTGLCGAIWAVVGKWYFDKKLEILKDELGQKRDLRQALIERGTLATQKALEFEFKVIQDLQSGIVRLHELMSDWGPYMEPDFVNDTKWTKLVRMIEHAKPLQTAHDDLLRVCKEMKPFYPESIYEAVEKCLQMAREEIHNLHTCEIVTTDSETFREVTQRAQENRNAFEPLSAVAYNLMREHLASLRRMPD
jgi:hypothetical protein